MNAAKPELISFWSINVSLSWSLLSSAFVLLSLSPHLSQVTSQRMQGLLLLVFAKYFHLPFLRGVQTETTRTGLGGYWVRRPWHPLCEQHCVAVHLCGRVQVYGCMTFTDDLTEFLHNAWFVNSWWCGGCWICKLCFGNLVRVISCSYSNDVPSGFMIKRWIFASQSG